MKITIDLHGWADSLTGNQKIVFAIQCAMLNSGYGLGYKIKFKSRPLFKGKTAVNNEHVFNVTASSVTSMHYVKGNLKDKTWDHRHFNFIANAYSVREIYIGAMKSLKKYNKERSHKRNWWEVFK